VVHDQRPNTGPVSLEAARPRDLFVGTQAPVVGQPRHRLAHRGVHAVREVQEIAALVGQRAVPFHQPAEG
jgi:hypothetical protein